MTGIERNRVRVFAPATVANVGCAFDVLGFAVDAPGDYLTAERFEGRGISIAAVHGDHGRLPLETSKNTAGVAAAHVLELLGEVGCGVSLRLEKAMPLGSGLGSSAASAVAGAVAVNALFGHRLSKLDLVRCAMEGERIACGTAHADNVAPALCGGFVLIRSYDPLDLVQLPVPDVLRCTIIHPHLEVLTEDARKVLRRQVPLTTAIRQFANIGGLIAGIFSSDYALIGRSLEDVIIEPERSTLIPGFASVKRAAINSGALGCAISGSGPSLFAFSTSDKVAVEIGDSMQQAFTAVGVESDLFFSSINSTGARVIEEV
jgi:homoserine kinase